VSILESKLDRDLNGPGSRRPSPQRQSSQFNILPKEIDEGVMIDVSMVAQTHLARKASFMSKSGAGNKSGKFGGSGVNSATGSNAASADVPRSASQGTAPFPAGAHVPAALIKEIEEQLADALYKRSQAKLMADPDQANVESALADGLKVR
jgi:hypothetical protein